MYLLAAFNTGEKIFLGTTERDNLVQNYLEKMNESDIDLLLFPASLIPAPKKVSNFNLVESNTLRNIISLLKV